MPLLIFPDLVADGIPTQKFHMNMDPIIQIRFGSIKECYYARLDLDAIPGV
jgi:hypothetical protein